MTTLRIALLVVGIIVIVSLYLYFREPSSGKRSGSPVVLKTRSPVKPGSVEETVADDLPVDEDHEEFASMHTGFNDEELDLENLPSVNTMLPASEHAGEELILSLSIMAHTGQLLTGLKIQQVLQSNDFHYGDMHIYHRFPGYAASGPQTVCSVANIMEPGVLSPDVLEQLETPGLLLFMRLPGPIDERDAFELWINAGRKLAGELDAQLCDEARNVLTAQETSMLRDKVEAFRFKRQMQTLRQPRHLN